jgi:hypothetical protein
LLTAAYFVTNDTNLFTCILGRQIPNLARQHG